MVEQIILRIARESGFGYTRILGELRHLALEVSRSTVVNILKKAGLPTGPERGESTWDQFVKAHAEILCTACSFPRRAPWTLAAFIASLRGSPRGPGGVPSI